MDTAISKVRRIEIIYNDGKSDIIRQIEPVKYFSDLEAKGLMFCPESKIAFMVSGSNKMVGSQVELLYAYEDMSDDSLQILKLDLRIVERGVLTRKRKYDEIVSGESVKRCKGLQSRSSQIHVQRSVYSDLAKCVKHLSRRLREIDNKSGNENEPLGTAVDDSENVLSDGCSKTEIQTLTEETSETG